MSYIIIYEFHEIFVNSFYIFTKTFDFPKINMISNPDHQSLTKIHKLPSIKHQNNKDPILLSNVHQPQNHVQKYFLCVNLNNKRS